MTFCYSEPFESLIEQRSGTVRLGSARVVIVGSGYGGSIAAHRLAGRQSANAPARDMQVVILERGHEYSLGEFPNTLGELPGHVAVHRHDRPDTEGNDDALFNIHLGEGVDVLVGSGLGGTSLINANVALRPTPSVFKTGHWPAQIASEAGTPGSALDDAFTGVSSLLEVADGAQLSKLRDLAKYKAFERFASALKCTVEPAPITVTLPGSPPVNRSGVAQPACTGCGNCVTGCNVGAKNTLAMNAIPSAYVRGARFFTGAQIISVQPVARGDVNAPRWAVLVEPTSRASRARFEEPFVIEADTVILSAGTLGSTEILQRSSLEGAIELSPTLGERFSTNGDAIAMSFAERDPVSALGTQAYEKTHTCGPTITAVATGKVAGHAGAMESFTLEEGAVPASFARLYAELLTTSAQIGRWGDNRLPAALEKKAGVQPDPLSVNPGAIDRSQVFLVMGQDGTGEPEGPRGRIRFTSEWDGPRSGFAVPAWAAGASGSAPPFTRIERLMVRHDRSQGLNGGQFVPSPMWKIVPESAAAVMSGTFPGGRLVTVHPLGGCAMSGSGLTGVVDHNGQVFRGAGDECHPGLYVLDGSIVPAALGVNPFLTIAALSWRACEAIAAELGAVPTQKQARPLPKPLAPLPRRTEPETDAIVVRERLVGQLAKESDGSLPEDLFPGSKRWFEADGLILQVQTCAGCTDDLLTASRPVKINAQLYCNPIDAATVNKSRMYGAPDAHLTPECLIAEGEGTLTVLQADFPEGTWERWKRTLGAFRAYLARRQSLWTLVVDQGRNRSQSRQPVSGMVGAMKDVAEMHATYRDFTYAIELEAVRTQGPLKQKIHIKGRKRLAWNVNNPRLWQSLLELSADVVIPHVRFRAQARFVVDMRYLLGSGLLSVAPGASAPAAMVSCLAFIARLARCILQASFWEFGSPDYPEKPIKTEPSLPRELRDGSRLETFTFNVPKKVVGGPTLPLKLHRYGNGGGEPVLLIHGLAQGSLIYASPALTTSMADYFRARGNDVWLVDYRLSNQLTAAEVPFDDWSIDEIGRFDIPAAVAEVLRRYAPGTRLHVFAHCVGAIGLTMAILSGRLDKRQLASVALNAIHPWTMPSAANSARAKLAVFYRDMVGDDLFDPIVQTRGTVSALQSMLDRLAFSLARLGEEEGEHNRKDNRDYANAICDRMTFMYGRMWRHKNVKAVHPHWKDLVGRSPGSVQRHLYYLLIRERVLDHEGLNCYLREPQLNHWRGIRTLFIHGEESGVFNPQSAVRSAVRFRRVLNRDGGTGKSTDTDVPDTPIGLRRVPLFGHMDVILAGNAAEESFRYVHHFFRGNFDTTREIPLPAGASIALDEIVADDDPHRAAKVQPEAGLIMRGARIRDGKLLVRYWYERPTMNTSLTGEVELVPPPETKQELLDGELEDQYCWLDATFDPLTFSNGRLRVKPGGSDTGVPMASLSLPAGLSLNLLEALASASGSASSIAALSIGGGLPGALPMGPGSIAPVALRLTGNPSWLRRLIERNNAGAPRDCYFIVGSCLYTGTPFDRELGDRIFAGMRVLLDSGADCDLLFLIGDQIYADATAGLLDPVSWRDRYTQRYREAFNGSSMSDVLGRVPCHFAVDDHEFADNYRGAVPPPPPYKRYRSWQEDAPARAIASGDLDVKQFAFAKKVARSYQGSARDLHPFGKAERPDRGALWYELDHDSEIRCPAFILDTRSERERASSAGAGQMMNERQLKALLSWLERVKDDPRPKFIFSGSVIAPLPRGMECPGMWMREDGMAGYPAQLEAIVSFIADGGIRRVVFVGGDLHLSCTASLTLVGKTRSVRALQIVSSGLYAPLPFANLDVRRIGWKQEAVIAAGDAKIRYTPEFLMNDCPHFVRVCARQSDGDQTWTIRAEAYGESGTEIAVPHEYVI